MKIQSIIICLILVFEYETSNAQAISNIENIGFEAGLSDLSIRCITQDKHGYMWFGTAYGLNRFDGYSIVPFFNDSSRSSLPSNTINCIFSDSKGKLWIGTSSGPAIYHPSLQNFERIDSISDLDKCSIQVIKEDPSNNIYIAGHNGIFKFDIRKKKWENLTVNLKRENELVDVFDIHFESSDVFYVTTIKKGFYKVDLSIRSTELIIYEDDDFCLWDIMMFKMVKIDKNEILIGFLRTGVRAYNLITGKFRKVKGPISNKSKVFWNRVPDLFRDAEGRVWIASQHYGLCEYLVYKDSVVSFQSSTSSPYGISLPVPNSVYKDQNGNIWVGTIGNGVFRLRTENGATNFYNQDDHRPFKMMTGSVKAIMDFNESKILIGNENGFSLYNHKAKVFENYPGEAIAKPNNFLRNVESITKDSSGFIWFGTGGFGLMRWKPNNRLPLNFNLNLAGKNFFSRAFVQSSVTFSDGIILYRSLGSVITFNPYNFKSDYFRDRKNEEFHVSNVLCFHIIENDKVLMFRSDEKLSLYDHKQNTLRVIPNPFEEKYPGIRITKASVDSFGNSYFATNNGFLVLKKDSSFMLYPMMDSISRTKYVSGYVKINDTVWLANNRRISILNLKTGQMNFLTQSDGFFSGRINGHTMTQSANGKIYVGAHNGLYEIDPNSYRKELKDYQPGITLFSVLNESPLPLCLDDQCKINLKYDQNNFSFQLSAFNFSEANEIKYLYTLEGFDTRWRETGTDRKGTYTNVNPGTYTLKSKIVYSSGEWSESKQKLIIRIDSPFYSTWWFRFLIIMIVLGIIYSFFRMKIKGIKLQEKLRSQYEIKLHELENSALRAQLNPHFVFNCLNTINAYIQNNDSANASMMVNKFSKLIRMILHHSSRKTISLREELDALDLYVSIELIRFESRFEFEINIDPTINPESVQMPCLIFQPFVERAILFGLLPLQHKGNLKLELKKMAGHLQCTILDNGIGRAQAKIIRQNRFVQNPHNIDITLKRLDFFNREEGLNLDVRILDLVNDRQHPIGTQVEIPLALVLSF